MQQNVGTIDRIIRVVLGIAIIVFGVMNDFAWWLWLGLIPLATGAFGYCLVYSLFGTHSHQIKDPTSSLADHQNPPTANK